MMGKYHLSDVSETLFMSGSELKEFLHKHGLFIDGNPNQIYIDRHYFESFDFFDDVEERQIRYTLITDLGLDNLVTLSRIL